MKHARIILAALCAMSCALALFTWFVGPYDFEPRDDSMQYHEIAFNLAASGRYVVPDGQELVPSADRLPSYPVFVASVYKLFGPSVAAVKAIQILFAPAIVLLTYLVGRRLLESESLALVAAAIAALQPSMLAFSNRLLVESMFTLAVLALVYAAIRWSDERTRTAAVACGAIALVVAFTKPEAILIFAPLTAALLYTTRLDLQTLGRLTLITVLIGALGTAWVVRNGVETGEYRLRVQTDPPDRPPLLREYRLRAETGRYFRPERHQYLYGKQWKEKQREYDEILAANAPQEDVSDIAFFLTHPKELLVVSAIRFYQLMKPKSYGEIFGAQGGISEAVANRNVGVLAAKLGTLALDILTCVVGLVGLVYFTLTRRNDGWVIAGAIVLYFIAIYCLLHGMQRYRVPYTPFFAIGATQLVASLLNAVRVKRTRSRT